MKKVLIVLGIIITTLEIGLYIFWYKELYFRQFLFLLILCQFANTSIFFGIMTKILPKEKRKLIINLSFLIFGLIIPIQYFNASRIQNWIDKEGIITKGIVREKKPGAKTSPYLITEFYDNNLIYKSTLSVPNSKKFEKIKLTDSVLIKYIKEYPKMNRTEKLLNK